MAEGSARPAGERVLLVRHRLPDGPRHVPRCRSPRRLERVGWDVETDGLAGSPPIPGRRRRPPRDDRPRAAALGIGSSGTVRVDVDDAAGCVPAALGPRSATSTVRRSSALRRARSTRARSTRSPRSWRLPRERTLAAHRRRVRPVGGRVARRSPPDRRRRAGGLLGDRCAQVAQRPVRQRPRVRALIRRLTAPRCAYGRLPRRGPRTRHATRWTGRPSSPAARGASRSTPRCGRSDASGVADLVDGSCARARRSPGRSPAPGSEVVNDVVLNQVLFCFADDETTTRSSRTFRPRRGWMSGTIWDGRSAIRLSVSNWRTTEPDIERALDAFDGALVAT